MKIRMHRGGLEESMQTLEEIENTIAAVHAYVCRHITGWAPEGPVVVVRYDDAPDERIGWNATWLVRADGSPIAFTDGPVTAIEVADNHSSHRPNLNNVQFAPRLTGSIGEDGKISVNSVLSFDMVADNGIQSDDRLMTGFNSVDAILASGHVRRIDSTETLQPFVAHTHVVKHELDMTEERKEDSITIKIEGATREERTAITAIIARALREQNYGYVQAMAATIYTSTPVKRSLSEPVKAIGSLVEPHTAHIAYPVEFHVQRVLREYPEAQKRKILIDPSLPENIHEVIATEQERKE